VGSAAGRAHETASHALDVADNAIATAGEAVEAADAAIGSHVEGGAAR